MSAVTVPCDRRYTLSRAAYSKREVINAGLMDRSYKIPGGYVSTPGDLTFADVLRLRMLMKADTLKLMWASQKLPDGQ